MPRYSRYFSLQAPGRSATAKSPIEQRLLQLEADDDVQVVGRFVGFDADQRRLDVVDRAVEIVAALTPPSRRRETPLAAAGRSAARTPGCGRRGSPTSATAIRGCPATRTCPGGRPNCSVAQALVVDAVPRFVQDAEEGRVEESLVVARRDAAIVRAHAACRTDDASRRAARAGSRSRSPPPLLCRTLPAPQPDTRG